MTTTGVSQLRVIADYQFGATAGDALFPAGETPAIRRSTSGRPQQVLADDGRIVSYGVDGRFTLGLAGGKRLVRAFPAPRNRVTVGAESVPFVRNGKNVFSKFVRRVDPAIRPGDEVCVVLDDDAEREAANAGDGCTETAIEPGALVAVGRAELGADAMLDFETGMAVKVREGVGAIE